MSNNRYQERCKHCTFINKQLGSALNTNHNSNNCGKRKLSVNVIESLCDDDSDSYCDNEDGISTYYDDGENQD